MQNEAEKLQEAYKVLGLSPIVTDMKEIKCAYRSKLNVFHPDKWQGKGASQGILDQAKERAQHIKDAYELLKGKYGSASCQQVFAEEVSPENPAPPAQEPQEMAQAEAGGAIVRAEGDHSAGAGLVVAPARELAAQFPAASKKQNFAAVSIYKDVQSNGVAGSSIGIHEIV